MNRSLAMLSFVTLLATVLSFGAARWLNQRSQAAGLIDVHSTRSLTAELALTAEQAAQIEKLEADLRTQIASFCEAHCAARFALSGELAKGTVDQTNATALLQRMTAAQNRAEQVTFDHILRVRQTLTPAQQQRYGRLINQQLYAACPLGLHAPN